MRAVGRQNLTARFPSRSLLPRKKDSTIAMPSATGTEILDSEASESDSGTPMADFDQREPDLNIGKFVYRLIQLERLPLQCPSVSTAHPPRLDTTPTEPLPPFREQTIWVASNTLPYYDRTSTIYPQSNNDSQSTTMDAQPRSCGQAAAGGQDGFPASTTHQPDRRPPSRGPVFDVAAPRPRRPRRRCLLAAAAPRGAAAPRRRCPSLRCYPLAAPLPPRPAAGARTAGASTSLIPFATASQSRLWNLRSSSVRTHSSSTETSLHTSHIA